MSLTHEAATPLLHGDRFFIGGEWTKPSTDAVIRVTDSATEELFFSVPEAREADMAQAAAAAREAFDHGPWPRMTHAQRAEHLRAFGAGIRERAAIVGQIWPRESGVLFKVAQ